VAGYSLKRHIPPFAPETFTPAVAKAAVEVLEDAGYHVLVPEASLCCGRRRDLV
jgi:Fe-S oxidoreductase